MTLCAIRNFSIFMFSIRALIGFYDTVICMYPDCDGIRFIAGKTDCAQYGLQITCTVHMPNQVYWMRMAGKMLAIKMTWYHTNFSADNRKRVLRKQPLFLLLPTDTARESERSGEFNWALFLKLNTIRLEFHENFVFIFFRLFLFCSLFYFFLLFICLKWYCLIGSAYVNRWFKHESQSI